MDGIFRFSCARSLRWLVSLLVWFLQTGVTDGYDTCTYYQGSHRKTMSCDYGCCGTETDRECCSYTISVSVLIVAGVVGGLVVLALIVAFIVCCVKNYKDKQTSRVRTMRQQQHPHRNAAVPMVPASPPKPPEYAQSPPPYSQDMPDSHFRPPTVTGNHPSNTRFSRGAFLQQHVISEYPAGARSVPGNNPGSAPSHTSASGIHPLSNGNQRFQPRLGSIPAGPATSHPVSQTAGLPGSISLEPPPAYSEFPRGRTPHPSTNTAST